MKRNKASTEVHFLQDQLLQRLSTISPCFGQDFEEVEHSPEGLLLWLFKRARDIDELNYYWLLIVGVTGALPDSEDVRDLQVALKYSSDETIFNEGLLACVRPAAESPYLHCNLKLLRHQLVVDVDFCAQHGHNTGIQRVVRETMKRWIQWNSTTFVAWGQSGLGMRTLDESEISLVTKWSSERILDRSEVADADVHEVVVPWESSLFLPEVAQERVTTQLAAMAELSKNAIGLIGYDAIPILSADAVPSSETDRFVHYLSAVKWADVVFGISDSAAEEFRGFVEALVSQGLAGPKVISVPLAEEQIGVKVHPSDSRISKPVIPIILSVGTQEPRKNQSSILAAAEELWSRGKSFELHFVGHGAYPAAVEFDEKVESLLSRGRKVVVHRQCSDKELEDLYSKARFTVFVSLHEGYGLPVAESLSYGVPVVATEYGSISEIARGGGCALVNPRSVEAISAAMDKLLTDDMYLESLVSEIRTRAVRTWDDYASELAIEFKLVSEGKGITWVTSN